MNKGLWYDRQEKRYITWNQLKRKLKKELKEEGIDIGIHQAYEAMRLGQDECYCDKCCRKRG